MLGANRTAIGRGLAIGRGSHGPPWRRRKPFHTPIVAPLTATLAAGAAVGLGLTLARVGRERRALRSVNATGASAVRAGEPLAGGLKRMAAEQLELAIEQLAAGNGGGARGRRRSTRRARRSSGCERSSGCSNPGSGSRPSPRRPRHWGTWRPQLSAARDAEVMLRHSSRCSSATLASSTAAGVRQAPRPPDRGARHGRAPRRSGTPSAWRS